MKTKLTVGLDLSLTSTGIVVWEEEVLFAINPKTQPRDGGPESRTAIILDAISVALKSYEPRVVDVENHAFGAIGGDTRPHELLGVVRFTLWNEGRTMRVVAPNTVKKFATGNGRASKEEMLEAAKVFWPDCPNHDLADALFIAKRAYETYN